MNAARKARQMWQATAGTKFTKPRAHLIEELCTYVEKGVQNAGAFFGPLQRADNRWKPFHLSLLSSCKKPISFRLFVFGVGKLAFQNLTLLHGQPGTIAVPRAVKVLERRGHHIMSQQKNKTYCVNMHRGHVLESSQIHSK